MQSDLTFLAVNEYNLADILHEETFFKKYLSEDGKINFEWGRLDSPQQVKTLLKYFFTDAEQSIELHTDNSKTILDLTAIKSGIISFETLESTYPDWISATGRENTMDEYGMLSCFAGYIHDHQHKNFLLLIIDTIS